MNLYSTDVQVIMTAYIKANSPEEAFEIAKKNFEDSSDEFSTGGAISDKMFDDEDLPSVSLSPAVTLKKILSTSPDQMTLSEEDIPEGGDDD